MQADASNFHRNTQQEANDENSTDDTSEYAVGQMFADTVLDLVDGVPCDHSMWPAPAHFTMQQTLPTSRQATSQAFCLFIPLLEGADVINEQAGVSPEIDDPFHFDWPHW